MSQQIWQLNKINEEFLEEIGLSGSAGIRIIELFRILTIKFPMLASMKMKLYLWERLCEKNDVFNVLCLLIIAGEVIPEEKKFPKLENMLQSNEALLKPTDELELRTLGISNVTLTLPESCKEALRIIARGREKGEMITQVFKHLQDKDLAGVSKNSNHIIKALEDEGLVVKRLLRRMVDKRNLIENKIVLSKYKEVFEEATEKDLGCSIGEKSGVYVQMLRWMKFLNQHLGITEVVLSDLCMLSSFDTSTEDAVKQKAKSISPALAKSYLTKLWLGGESLLEITTKPTTYLKSKLNFETKEGPESIQPDDSEMAVVTSNKASSPKTVSTQFVAVAVLHEFPLRLEDSTKFESERERMKSVEEMKILAAIVNNGRIGRDFKTALVTQVHRIVSKCGVQGITLKDLTCVLNADPKQLYRLVKKLVDSNETGLARVKELGESPQTQRRVFLKSYLSSKN